MAGFTPPISDGPETSGRSGVKLADATCCTGRFDAVLPCREFLKSSVNGLTPDLVASSKWDVEVGC